MRMLGTVSVHPETILVQLLLLVFSRKPMDAKKIIFLRCQKNCIKNSNIILFNIYGFFLSLKRRKKERFPSNFSLFFYKYHAL